MVIDFLAYIEDLNQRGVKLTMKQLTEISGINRYTLSMAINHEEGFYRNCPADAYFGLYNAHPDVLELPSDFYNYSTMSFIITMELSGMNYDEVSKKTGIPKTTLSSRMRFKKKPKKGEESKDKGTYFIYDYKDYFGAFDKLYVPTLNGEVATKRPAEMDAEVFREKILEAIDRPIGKTDRETFIVNANMYGIAKSTVKAVQKELSTLMTLTDEEFYYLCTSAFDEIYDVDVVEPKAEDPKPKKEKVDKVVKAAVEATKKKMANA